VGVGEEEWGIREWERIKHWSIRWVVRTRPPEHFGQPIMILAVSLTFPVYKINDTNFTGLLRG
jgi:hypothetical protein